MSERNNLRILACTLGKVETLRWHKLLEGLKTEQVCEAYWQLGSGSHVEFDENGFFELDKLMDLHKSNLPQKLRDEVYMSSFPTFIDMMSRLAYPGGGRNQYARYNYHEYQNIFYLYLDYFFDILTDYGINLVIFDSSPHLGFDYLLYVLARRLNVSTLIFFQSLMPGRFFYFETLEDCGKFSVALIDEAYHVPQLLKQEQRPAWHYMKANKVSRLTNAVIAIVNFTKRILKGMGWRSNKPIVVWQDNIYMLLQCLNKRVYVKQDKQFFCDEKIDYSVPYVYFALHMQPEQTTSALGGYYVDQLLALECLARSLPKTWVIYVKENPKQTYFMRSPFFFKRLKTIKNVRLISRRVSSFDLLKYAKIIATVNGTVGYEALVNKKPVIYFGYAWYASLPGAFQYKEGLDLLEISKTAISEEKLQQAFAALMKKTAAGVVNSYYERIVEGYSEERNHQILLKSLINIFSRLPYA